MVLASLIAGVLAPVAVFAQGGSGGGITGGTQIVTFGTCANSTGTTTLATMICKINQLLGLVVPVLIALGVVYFIWGVVSYVIGTDEEAKAAGRQKIIWGIIGLAVVIGVWGLVGILNRTFGVDAAGVVLPVVPGFNNF